MGETPPTRPELSQVVINLGHGLLVKGAEGKRLAYFPLVDEGRLRCQRCGRTLAKPNSQGQLACAVKCTKCDVVTEIGGAAANG